MEKSRILAAGGFLMGMEVNRRLGETPRLTQICATESEEANHVYRSSIGQAFSEQKSRSSLFEGARVKSSAEKSISTKFPDSSRWRAVESAWPSDVLIGVSWASKRDKKMIDRAGNYQCRASCCAINLTDDGIASVASPGLGLLSRSFCRFCAAGFGSGAFTRT